MSKTVILNWTAEIEQYWNPEHKSDWGEPDGDWEDCVVLKLNNNEIVRRKIDDYYRDPEDAITEFFVDLMKSVLN